MSAGRARAGRAALLGAAGSGLWCPRGNALCAPAAGITADILQEAQVHYIDYVTCNSSTWYRGNIHSNNICAGHKKGGIDSCQVCGTGPSPPGLHELGAARWSRSHACSILSFSWPQPLPAPLGGSPSRTYSPCAMLPGVLHRHGHRGPEEAPQGRAKHSWGILGEETGQSPVEQAAGLQCSCHWCIQAPAEHVDALDQ